MIYICFMQVDDALIDKLSRLSMLSFNEEERESIKKDLEKMIGFVDKLKELDTTGVEPTTHMTTAVNNFREDVVGQMLTQQEALKNAPIHDSNFFQVPKVIKKNA
jgi:aspartyl-tRNA(Asn)/glutamyl-tRNA(Gln) amidotransferase subunit C